MTIVDGGDDDDADHDDGYTAVTVVHLEIPMSYLPNAMSFRTAHSKPCIATRVSNHPIRAVDPMITRCRAVQ